MYNPSVEINLSHHTKKELCTTRPAYRQGRKLTSVKVYTVCRESQHLLVYNVPAINLDSELRQHCERYGTVTSCTRVPSQDVEEFTIVYHVRFDKVYQARFAKRKMDNLSFYGGVLHVCYAPELETVDETKEKFSIRRREISFRLKNMEFPKQFRPTRKRGVKEKFNDFVSNTNFMDYNYLAAVNPSSNNEQNDVRAGTSQQSSTVTESTISTNIIQGQLKRPPPVDVKPFKKLIPTKIARIVFHNKSDHLNK